jgi:hypothetical protein
MIKLAVKINKFYLFLILVLLAELRILFQINLKNIKLIGGNNLNNF